MQYFLRVMRVPGLSAAGGVIVTLEGAATPGLRLVAKKWSLMILEVEAAELAFQHIRSGRPRLIIVQVGQEAKEALRFIRLAVAARLRVPLIAATVRHTTQLEQQLLCAGATCYVPGVAPGFLDPVLEAVLPVEEHKCERF